MTKLLQSHNNFLSESSFKVLKDIFFSQYTAWYYRDHQTKDDGFFFGHDIFLKNLPCSNIYENLTPLLDKLCIKPEQLINIRANLLLKTQEHNYSDFHIDCQSNVPFTTAIFYINTNNGGTIFEENNLEIKSEENKVITFDGNFKHKAKSQTDTDRRIVINFNWRNV